MNASFMLGSLVSIVMQSWCMESKNDSIAFCVADKEDLKLLTAGIILLVSVAPAFLNTCLTRNINLPHSYQELKQWCELRSDTRPSQVEVELVEQEEEEEGA